MTSPVPEPPLSASAPAVSDLTERLAALDDTPTAEHLSVYRSVADELAARLEHPGSEHPAPDGIAGG